MSRLYYFLAGFFILQAIEAFSIVDRLVYGEWLGKPGDKITQSLNLLLILTSLALFGKGYRRIRSIRTSAILSLGLVVFLLLSTLWSVNRGASMRTAIEYLFVLVGAIGIVGSLEADEFMDLLALMCFLEGIVSLLLLAVSPGSALTPEGDFRGIFSQKNVLGEAMTMGALASLHGLRVRQAQTVAQRRLSGGGHNRRIGVEICDLVLDDVCLLRYGRGHRSYPKGRRRAASCRRCDRFAAPHRGVRRSIPGFDAGDDRQGPDIDRAHGYLGLCDRGYSSKAVTGMGIRCVLVP